MKKFMKFFSILLAFLPMVVVLAACGEKPPEAPVSEPHVHSFSVENEDYCEGCKSYVVKGTGSQYLTEGETAKNLEDVWQNATPVDGVMNYIISGDVVHNQEGTYSFQNIDLSKDAAIVNIVGEGEGASLTITGKYYAGFYALESKLYFENLIINSARNLGEYLNSWEWYHLISNATEVKFTNCKFTEGVKVEAHTKATFETCEFQVSGNHYSIWVGSKGNSALSHYTDNIESCIIKNCTFNSTRGIKVLSSGAEIIIEENTFNNLSGKPGIVLDSDFGEKNTVKIKNNKFNGCVKGTWNHAENTLYDEPYNLEYFDVTASGNIVNG